MSPDPRRGHGRNSGPLLTASRRKLRDLFHDHRRGSSSARRVRRQLLIAAVENLKRFVQRQRWRRLISTCHLCFLRGGDVPVDLPFSSAGLDIPEPVIFQSVKGSHVTTAINPELIPAYDGSHLITATRPYRMRTALTSGPATSGAFAVWILLEPYLRFGRTAHCADYSGGIWQFAAL